MPLKLANYKSKAQKAIQTFWSTRDSAKQKQIKSGKSDHGERASVTGGKNMDGFISLIIDVVKANGLKGAQFHVARSVLTLPGFYRPTKLWDLLIFNNGKLVAAIELKSQVGPSFGNNFNNRAEEAIGTAHDFWTAYREGALGKNNPRPFVGWIMLVEDDKKSREPVKVASPHFNVFKEFEGASYLERYSVLCQKLMQENLYSNACLLASPRTSSKNGSFSSLSEMTSLRNFVTSLAGHIATESANSRS